MVRRTLQDNWLEMDGRRVFYRTLPAGESAAEHPPLLLVHGIACCTETWKPFLDELAVRVEAPQIIVPDLPAHGRTEKPGRILGMADFGAWVERFLSRLAVPRVDVMGHSMGCQVTLALADLFPERVRRAILLGPTMGGRHVPVVRNFGGLLADSAMEPLSYNLLLQTVFFRMGPLRYLRTVRQMQRDDAFEHARRIEALSLVLQGTRDAIIPKHAARELAHAFPRGEYRQIEGAAHAAQYTHPEETAATVLAFTGRPGP